MEERNDAKLRFADIPRIIVLGVLFGVVSGITGVLLGLDSATVGVVGGGVTGVIIGIIHSTRSNKRG